MSNFESLLRFLVTPFLEAPDDLKVDFETLSGGQRVWIRVAFSEADRGKVFGRGGRNIQAIRTVLKSAGTLNGCSVHLDVYGESSQSGGGGSDRGGRSRGGRGRPRGGRPSKPQRRD